MKRGFRQTTGGVCLAAVLLGVPATALATDPVQVEVGTSTLLTLPSNGADAIHVANPAIFDVIPVTSERLVILGLRSGQSNLLVLDTAGKELFNAPLIVVPQRASTVTVYRGPTEITLSCHPRCVETSAAMASGSSRPTAPSAATPQNQPGTTPGGSAASLAESAAMAVGTALSSTMTSRTTTTTSPAATSSATPGSSNSTGSGLGSGVGIRPLFPFPGIPGTTTLP